MDNSNLIDFDISTNNCKTASPLIPIPKLDQEIMCRPRLSDGDNNPFDKVFRDITNKDEPFENIFETLNTKNIQMLNALEKENISRLISPCQTRAALPRDSLSNARDSLGNMRDSLSNMRDSLSNMRDSLNISDDRRNSYAPDWSMQILNETALNFPIDTEYITPPKSPERDKQNINNACDSKNVTFKYSFLDTMKQRLNSSYNIPSVFVYDENNSRCRNHSFSGLSVLNTPFARSDTENSRKLSTKSSAASSVKNISSFNSESLGTSQISSICYSASSIDSKEFNSSNIFNRGFLKDSQESHTQTQDSNVFNKGFLKDSQESEDTISTSHTQTQHNSVSEDGEIELDDDVFVKRVSKFFSSFVEEHPEQVDDPWENLDSCTPPWLTDDEVFISLGDNESNEREVITKSSENTKTNVVIELDNKEVKDKVLKKEKCSDISLKEIGGNITPVDKITTELLENSTENVSCGAQAVGLGMPTVTDTMKNKYNDNKKVLNNSTKMEVPKIKSLSPRFSLPVPKIRTSSLGLGNLNSKAQNSDSLNKGGSLPKIRTQSLTTAPTQFEKNIKLKNEKEKTTSKGPLKAVIPVTNMAKDKKSVSPAPAVTMRNGCTPPKTLQIPSPVFHIKRTSTPNAPKLGPPIAQSTPDICVKSVISSTKRLMYSYSPFSRPASVNDVSDVNSKKLSPTNTSGSAPNVSEGALNKSALSNSKLASNSSIPSMKSGISRRNSASDLKSSVKSGLNRSYDSHKKPVQTSQLKRSSSFQSKSCKPTENTNGSVNNNIPHNKFASLGSKLKPLSLISKAKKPASTDNKKGT